MFPAGGQTIARPDLGMTLEEYNLNASRMGFIGHRVFPIFPTAQQTANIGRIKIEDLMKVVETSRATNGGYRRDETVMDQWSYATEEHGREEVIDDRRANLYANMIDSEMVARDTALDKVLRKYEVETAEALYNTSVWTGEALTTGINNEWDDATNAVPIDDVLAAKEKVAAGLGMNPNALIINDYQRTQLKKCDQIIDRIKFNGPYDPLNVTDADLAKAFDLQYVIVADSLRNNSQEGVEKSMGRIWSNEYAMVARISDSMNPIEPCIGRTFLWTGDGGGMAPGGDQLSVIVEEYLEDRVRGKVIRVRGDYQIKVMYAQAGHLLSNVIKITD